MSSINEVLLKDYVDKQFTQLNLTINNLNQQLVTVIQSLECEVKKSYNKDIVIAQLRSEVSTLEKMLDKYVAVSNEVSQPRNVKKINTSNESYTNVNFDAPVNKPPKAFMFGFKSPAHPNSEPNPLFHKNDTPTKLKFGASSEQELETRQETVL